MKKTLHALLAVLLFSAAAPAQISFQDIPGLPFLDSQGYIRGLTWVDVDGDNDLDVSVSGITGTFPNFVNATAIYLNDAGGGFANTGLIVSSQADPFGQGWADYDNDGDLDVYYGATHNNGGLNELWRNEGGVSFMQITTSGATSNIPQPFEGTVSWGDYDNDGFADLILATWNNLLDRLFHNNGDGTFTQVFGNTVAIQPGWTSGCYWADFDNDRDLDLYSAHYQLGPTDPAANKLYENNGDGSFTDLLAAGEVVTDAQNTRSANWVDVNNDGLLDLFVGNQFAEDKIYYNQGDGTFSAHQGLGDPTYTTWSSNWGDIDNDGDQDLFTMGFWGFESKCWRNDGEGVFTDITASFPNIYPLQTSGSSSNAVVLVDYDRDGWLDLHIAQPDAIDDHLYRNLGDGCKSWLEVECIGVQSNRAAIGATIRAKATVNGTPLWQMRQVSSQTAATGQNPLWQHFGFGNAKIIDSLVVEWPSGMTCVFEQVAVNQLVEIEETCSLQTILSTPLGNAGEDAQADWCEGDEPVDLFTLLGGNPDTGGQWVDASYQPVSMPVGGTGEWYYLIDGPCGDTSKVSLTAHPLPQLSILPGDTILDFGETLELLASGALSYSWSPDAQLSCANCPDPVFTAEESTILTVTGEDGFGCKNSASISIEVLLVDLSFELPNAFTPDGDGANDTFRPLFNGEVFQDFQLLIFDRWGEKVYQSKDPGTGWNGQLDGKPMPSDVFAFFMEYTLMDGTEGTEKGEITLLR